MQEGGVDRRKGDEALRRKACSKSDRMLFRNAHIECAVRELFHEFVEAGAGRHGRRDADNTLIGLGIAQQPGSRYKRSVKRDALPRFLQTFGPEFHYREDGGMAFSFLNRSSLLPHHDKRRMEDYISGVWGGVPFSLMEAKLIDVRGSGKNRHEVTVFDGIFAIFEPQKDIPGRTIIRRDMGAVGNWFGDAFSQLERVALEDLANRHGGR